MSNGSPLLFFEIILLAAESNLSRGTVTGNLSRATINNLGAAKHVCLPKVARIHPCPCLDYMERLCSFSLTDKACLLAVI